jgi:GT2 family glycosyltransferase
MRRSERGAQAPFLFGLLAGVPSGRDEALVASAITNLNSAAAGDALVAAESVCRRVPSESAPAMLRASLLERFVPSLAPAGWQAAWMRDPQRAELQDAMLRLWLKTNAAAKVRELGPAFLPSRCRAGTHEPLLELMRQAGITEAGACWREGDEIAGMCFDLSGERTHLELLLSCETSDRHETVPVGEVFRLRVPAEGGAWSVCFAHRGGQLLQGSPVVLGQTPVGPSADKIDDSVDAVDIIVPVYKDFPGVRRCISSVLASLPQNRATVRIVVVNDASPDHLLSAWLEQLSVSGRITLLRNRFNLGFIEAANRGLRECADSHALLLNADTEVCGDWIDRLLAALRQGSDIACVMPWSNNGEMGSLTEPMEGDEPPSTQALTSVDGLIARMHSECLLADVEVPACCGFAMLIRRSALARVGCFDGAGLTRGYLEEADWCMRARTAGYRNVLATGVFVAHRGGASFGAEKTLRVAQNRATLASRYPEYYPEYAAFLSRDPLRSMREQVLRELSEIAASWPAKAGANPGDRPSFVTALPTRCVRLCVWAPLLSSKGAAKVLALARALSLLPSRFIRLLVIGGVSEAVWHTGVADVLPPAGATDFLGDDTLLSLSNTVLVLTEHNECPLPRIARASLHEFDLTTWLNQKQFTAPFLSQDWLHRVPRLKAA